MKTRTLALSIAVGAAVASAQNLVPPGYLYGLYNCGPASGVTSSAACLQCCRSAYTSGTLQYDEWQDCRSFCQQANFAPPARLPWYYRPIIWIFGR